MSLRLRSARLEERNRMLMIPIARSIPTQPTKAGLECEMESQTQSFKRYQIKTSCTAGIIPDGSCKAAVSRTEPVI